MADPELIRKIVEANDIVEVISGYFPLDRAGREFRALSPFSSERTPSFFVVPDKQIFHCFSSQQGGDVIRFLQLYENLSFPEALKKLAERAGINLEEGKASPREVAENRKRTRLRDLHDEARRWFHYQLMKSPQADAARAYLKTRGITGEMAKHWELGYAPDQSRVFLQWARQRGFDEATLVEGGLGRTSERGTGIYAHFRHRLMFPIANDFGQTIAFSGRVLDPDQKGGKYVNSPETPIFQKSRTFFGFDKSKQAILKARCAVICEGQLDLIMAFENGVQNLVAPLGTAFTEAHARLLRRHTEEVVICFDADRAGRSATAKAFVHLAQAGILVRVARMPPGEDPDSLIRKSGAAAFQAMIDSAADYFDFQIDAEIEGRGPLEIRERFQLAERLGEQLALIDGEMKRGLVIERVSTRLGVASRELENIVARTLEEKRNRARRGASHPSPASTASPGSPGSPGSPDSAPSAPEMALPHWNVLRELCRVLLCSDAGRAWILEHGERRLFADIPDTALPTLFWDGGFTPSDPASRAAFVLSLPAAAHNAANRLLMERGPEDDLATARGCLRSIKRKSLENRIAAATGRLKSGNLSSEGFQATTKELLDLQSRLKNLHESSVEPHA